MGSAKPFVRYTMARSSWKKSAAKWFPGLDDKAKNFEAMLRAQYESQRMFTSSGGFLKNFTALNHRTILLCGESLWVNAAGTYEQIDPKIINELASSKKRKIHV